MSLTYSVTACGLEASRASTSSALRSDLSVFLPANVAAESHPVRLLVMSCARDSGLPAAHTRAGAGRGGDGTRRAETHCEGSPRHREGCAHKTETTKQRRDTRTKTTTSGQS